MKMKNVLFAHDGPMYSNSEKTMFYGVHYNDALIDRYSYFGKNVSFLMRSRMIPRDKKCDYAHITYPWFSFIDVPDFKSIKSYFKKAHATTIIKRAVEENDIIIVRLPSAIGTIAFEHAKALGKPVLIEVVACVYDALWNYDWRGKLIAKQKMKKYQHLLKRASHVIYVTNAFLQNRYPTRGKSISCSDVMIHPTDDCVLQNRISKIRNSQNGLVLGTVGAIDVPYKGQGDVIKAVAIMKGNGIATKYKIVGQGESGRLQAAIQEFDVAESVEIVGPLTSAKVFAFLDTIDVYVQPSRQEGLPRAVIEAMSRACPVLGSDVAGIPELINKQALFEPGNTKQIVSLIMAMTKETLAELATENFFKAKDFEMQKLDSKRTEFYEEFLNDFGLGKKAKLNP